MGKTRQSDKRRSRAKNRREIHPKARRARKVLRRTVSRGAIRKTARARATPSSRVVAKTPARSAVRLAARVLSRRAAKAARKPQAPATVRALPKPIPALTGSPKARPARPHGAGHAAHSRSTPRPVSRQQVRISRVPQFAYMRAPGAASGFDVGDTVEVFCDHERNSERVRGWTKGVVVQVDNKLVAVQFRTNVFLTDGWMVPDRILWYSVTSDQIRAAALGKKGNRRAIPDF